MITDSSSNVISETKYKACPLRLRYGMLREGETRYSSGTNPTDYTYTGQYSYTDDFGLMFYNARWYDPSLGRFAQADTIVPNGVQGLDRYAYVNNSPINYADPSGHLAEDKVKKLLGLEDMTEKEFKKWQKSNSALWNSLLGAKVGDMIVFMSEVDGETVYQEYIIGENQNGNYVFWGLNNQQQENQCESTCFINTPPTYTETSQREVLEHIQNGNQWGLYELNPDSPTSYYNYNLEASSSDFIAMTGEIVLPNNQLWKQHGQERLVFGREIGITGGLGIIGGLSGCIGSATISFGVGCAISGGAALWIALADSTVSGPSYYPQYHHPYEH
ncbi:MAG: RHS repeat-associated core domain-containing protein [Anaerolineales bacterium]|nr:RHS repeat-associated core domain-containing protein [Anaerolineales bacterium]MBX3038072.1 RHS repeat-associated core domain-containing protein [Anaerolineales bacterium]